MSVATVYWRWLVLAAPLPDDSPRIARDGDDRLRSSPLTPLCRERSIFAQIFRDRQAPMPRVDRTQRKLGWACNWRIAPARSRRRHPYTSSVQQPQRAGPCITIGARTPEADVTKKGFATWSMRARYAQTGLPMASPELVRARPRGAFCSRSKFAPSGPIDEPAQIE